MSFYFTFTNGNLAAIQNPPKVEFETNKYFGKTPWEVPKAVDPEVKLAKVLEGQDLTTTELLERIEEWRQYRLLANKGKEPMNILPGVIIMAPFWAAKIPEINRAKREALKLAEQFDPYKIKLGMKTNETRAAFGEPELRIKRMSNCVEHVYGSKLSPFAPAITPSVWVSVVFQDGHVTRIFSHDFFDKRLVNGVP